MAEKKKKGLNLNIGSILWGSTNCLSVIIINQVCKKALSINVKYQRYLIKVQKKTKGARDLVEEVSIAILRLKIYSFPKYLDFMLAQENTFV